MDCSRHIEFAGKNADRRRDTVSAIIPTYNRPRLLMSALETVVAQTRAPDRIIVIDDGSDGDDTRQVALSFNGVEYYRRENGGKSAALNFALALIESGAVWIFDDDDLAEPYALELLEDALLANPHCSFAFGEYDNFVIGSAGEMRTSPGPNSLTPQSEDVFLDLLEKCFIFQPALLVQISAYRSVGSFDESLRRSQDFDMALRLSASYLGTKVNRVLFHQRLHDGPRGRGSALTSSESRDQRWAESDQVAVRKVLEVVPLSRFQLKKQASTTSEDYLSRARYLAKKGMWREASEDLQVAIEQIGPREGGLTRLERHYLREFMNNDPRGLRFLPDARFASTVVSSIKNRSLRREVRSALIWPLFHHLKAAIASGNLTKARRVISGIARFGTPLSIFNALKSRTRKLE